MITELFINRLQKIIDINEHHFERLLKQIFLIIFQLHLHLTFINFLYSM